MSDSAFYPTGATANVAITGASSAAAPITTPEAGTALRVFNDSATKTFIKWGTSALTDATTADFPLAPNSVEVIRIPQQTTHIKCIGGTGTLYFTKGEGV